ncbi:pentatricopeptide repeat-containing protein At2g35030, mitochondrial-like [Cryptomeria japonica]|uniref:pentatricopeptide repeat-containing protein At2g35030, mitochondrial-like n=1 Tax=Cryptomeria japonica TaxID=3369 RepID=UPI0025ABB9D0|nr:pentatricopeptide repeat-containing protein At2g35030, mitochondrial-like [Cryptomeria japonica]
MSQVECKHAITKNTKKDVTAKTTENFRMLCSGFMYRGVSDRPFESNALSFKSSNPTALLRQYGVGIFGLVDVYAKCGSVDKVCGLFDRMPQRNVFSWSAMIGGYAQNGFVGKAVETFKETQFFRVKPNLTTFASILYQNGSSGTMHGHPSKQNVARAFVRYYSWKCCGRHACKMWKHRKARERFDKMPERNVVSWNATIARYALNGFVEKALEPFKKMKCLVIWADLM